MVSTTAIANGTATSNGPTTSGTTGTRVPSSNNGKNNGSSTANAKPRRNTIMAVNGQFPHSNGL